MRRSIGFTLLFLGLGALAFGAGFLFEALLPGPPQLNVLLITPATVVFGLVLGALVGWELGLEDTRAQLAAGAALFAGVLAAALVTSALPLGPCPDGLLGGDCAWFEGVQLRAAADHPWNSTEATAALEAWPGGNLTVTSATPVGLVATEANLSLHVRIVAPEGGVRDPANGTFRLELTFRPPGGEVLQVPSDEAEARGQALLERRAPVAEDLLGHLQQEAGWTLSGLTEGEVLVER